MKEWSVIARDLDRLLHDTQEKSAARMAGLKEDVSRGAADSSHIAAGQALASAILTITVINDDIKLIHSLLQDHQEARKDRDVFRFDFARCLLQLLLAQYLDDELTCSDNQLNGLVGSKLLFELLRSLAYASGELSEEIGFLS